ncbi:malto-oligosyltrehalose trehalohydrolase [Candidatus Micrarchaeota archaeon]|nr:malto-oligosyltrehalose trehalohydrolase [Candidatus Micrarchaeota archaeon]
MLHGPLLNNDEARFNVWAPHRNHVAVRVKDDVQSMKREYNGIWSTTLSGARMGTRYSFLLDETLDRPDPASHFQPEGVHQSSELVDHNVFEWDDDHWRGPNPASLIIYELHVGTFTRKGTFDGVIRRLRELKELGITALELMPVSPFPGTRNWGYDGVYPYAVQHSYGGPHGLKRLVNAAHQENIAVLLDVVYNHLGPEGNYFADFGPYFTERYSTPWGKAIDFDGKNAQPVRAYFIQNALHWMAHYRMDGLRLDAIHAIFDRSRKHVLKELAEEVTRYEKKSGRQRILIAESDLNDSKVVRPWTQKGYGINEQWLNDFHHSIHGLLTHETQGYYEDFKGLDSLVKCLNEGFVYSGQYSRYRKRHHGNATHDMSPRHFVSFIQSHDEVGNRALGERLSSLVSFPVLKVAASLLFFSPYTPMLFMGEEYGERHPFQYFISHSDARLIQAVRSGRKKEFSAFRWKDRLADPQDPKTFLRSILSETKPFTGKARHLREAYQTLSSLRKTIPALSDPKRRYTHAWADKKNKVLYLSRKGYRSQVLAIFHFGRPPITIHLPFRGERWQRVWDSENNQRKANPLAPDKAIRLKNMHSILLEKVNNE